MTQFMTAAEQVEHGHTARGEPTYAKLQEQRDVLLAALEQIMVFGGGCCCPQAGGPPNPHSQTCREARAAIAKAKGE